MKWLLVLVVSALVAGGGWISQSYAQDTATVTPMAGASAEATPDVCVDQNEKITELEAQVKQLKKDLAKERKGDDGGDKKDDNKEKTGKKHKIGDTFKANVWEITVTGYETAPQLSSSYDTYTARGIFVIVYLSVNNDGNEPAYFPYDDLMIQTSEGRSYNYNSDATIGMVISSTGMGTYENLQPGLPIDTMVVFDVPADASGLLLTEKSKSWTVTLE